MAEAPHDLPHDAAAAAAHGGSRMPHAEPNAFDIHGQDSIENLLRILVERGNHALDARVVEQDVQTPETFLGRADVARHVGRDGDVGAHPDRLRSRLLG